MEIKSNCLIVEREMRLDDVSDDGSFRIYHCQMIYQMFLSDVLSGGFTVFLL